MTADQLAKIICKVKGKNPDRDYKGKKLWLYKVEFAEALLKELDKFKYDPSFAIDGAKIKSNPGISPLEYDEKIKNACQCFIEIFNDGTPLSLGKFVHVNNMNPGVLNLHMRSMKAAIKGIIK